MSAASLCHAAWDLVLHHRVLTAAACTWYPGRCHPRDCDAHGQLKCDVDTHIIRQDKVNCNYDPGYTSAVSVGPLGKLAVPEARPASGSESLAGSQTPCCACRCAALQVCSSYMAMAGESGDCSHAWLCSLQAIDFSCPLPKGGQTLLDTCDWKDLQVAGPL